MLPPAPSLLPLTSSSIPSLQPTPTLLPPPALKTQPFPSAALPLGVSSTPVLLPSAHQSAQDKYSALRDLLGSSPSLESQTAQSPENVKDQPNQLNRSADLHSSLLDQHSMNNSHSSSLDFQNNVNNSLEVHTSSQNTSLDLHNTSSDTLLQPNPFLPSSKTLQPQAASSWETQDEFGDFASFSAASPSPSPFSSSNSWHQPVSFTPSVPPSQPSEADEWSLPEPGSAILPPPSRAPLPASISSAVPYLSSSPPPPSFLSSSPPPLHSSSSPSLRVEEFALPSEQLNLSDRELFGVRKNELETIKKKNNMGEVQPSSIQDIITNQGQGRKMKTEVRGEGDPVASQATQHTAPSKSVAEEAQDLNEEEGSIDEWSIAAPPVDEWSVPPPTESVPTTSAKEGKIHEVETELRRASKADSWSLSPEKEDEVAHLFYHIPILPIDDTFCYRSMTGVSLLPQMTGVHRPRAS